jgi:hypothetical protein
MTPPLAKRTKIQIDSDVIAGIKFQSDGTQSFTKYVHGVLKAHVSANRPTTKGQPNELRP